MFDAVAMKCLWAAAGLLVVGLFAWRRSRRRVGDTPHCRRCDYILIQHEGRCPECGTEISPRTVVHGERRRHAAWLMAAVLLLLGSLLGVILPVTGVVGHVDWFLLRPAGLLVKDLNSSDPRVARRAWAELERRARAWSLSTSRDAQLIDLCLGEMTAPTKRPTRDAAVIFLGDRAARHALSPVQESRFFDALIRVTLVARTRVGPGDLIPCSVEMRAFGPAAQPPRADVWFYRITRTSLTVDGTRAADDTKWHVAGGWNRYRGVTARLTATARSVGRHELGISVPLEVCYGQERDPRAPVRFTLLRRATAPVEVLPATPPIEAVDRPGLADQLKAAVRIKGIDANGGGSPTCWVNYNVSASPIPFAAHVVLVAQGKEYPVGSIAFEGSGSDGALWTERLPPGQGKVDVIVRGDAAAARETLSLYANWLGEIVFHDVTVRGPAPATQP